MLKEYTHWALEVSYRQHTLGSFIIFCKRSVENLSELSNEEIVELKEVMREMESVLEKVETFKPDKFNYWQMGNALHHLHVHGIPRYASSRFFVGKEWKDETWGTVPVWRKEDNERALIVQIRDAILPFVAK